MTSRQNSSELIEKRANAFAASFLVPKGGVETYLSAMKKGGSSRRNFHVYDVASDQGMETERRSLASEQEITYQDGALLAAHNGVSYHMAVYRLGDLNYIDRDELKGLIQQAAEADAYLDCIGRKEEISGGPTAQDRDLKGQVIPLALEAYRRGEIKKVKLLELGKLLKLDAKKLTALM